MTTGDLLRPRELPDGRVSMEGEAEIDRLLREGDPTCGWHGDATLSLWYNAINHKWEVWRRGDLDGTATFVCSATGDKLPGKSLLRALAAHDTRHHDVVAELDKHNAMVARQQEADFHAKIDDLSDKLAWALGKDLGEPAQDGRLYSLAPGTPKGA